MLDVFCINLVKLVARKPKATINKGQRSTQLSCISARSRLYIVSLKFALSINQVLHD